MLVETEASLARNKSPCFGSSVKNNNEIITNGNMAVRNNSVEALKSATGFQTSSTLDQLSNHNNNNNGNFGSTNHSKKSLKKPTIGLHRGSPIPAARRSHEDVMAVMRLAHGSTTTTTDMANLHGSQRYLLNGSVEEFDRNS